MRISSKWGVEMLIEALLLRFHMSSNIESSRGVGNPMTFFNYSGYSCRRE